MRVKGLENMSWEGLMKPGVVKLAKKKLKGNIIVSLNFWRAVMCKTDGHKQGSFEGKSSWNETRL